RSCCAAGCATSAMGWRSGVKRSWSRFLGCFGKGSRRGGRVGRGGCEAEKAGASCGLCERCVSTRLSRAADVPVARPWGSEPPTSSGEKTPASADPALQTHTTAPRCHARPRARVDRKASTFIQWSHVVVLLGACSEITWTYQLALEPPTCVGVSSESFTTRSKLCLGGRLNACPAIDQLISEQALKTLGSKSPRNEHDG
ncbi:MAG: hypothetical protein ACI9NC_004992, partial [Verrucomicrobiales bacterium]